MDFYCEEVFSGKTHVAKLIETEHVLAYHHTRPFWETHIVVVPKQHVNALLELESSDAELVLRLFEVIKQIAAEVYREKGAVRVLTNIGRYQDSKHLHFHVYSGEQLRKDEK